MAMDDIRSEDQEAVIFGSIDRFLERDVAPYVHQLERDDEYPAEMVERMRELGLFGATIPAAYGGLGLSAVLYARIVERISRVWMSLTGIFNSHLIMAAAVERFGTEPQKQQFLPRFALGELRGGLAIITWSTAPRPGSRTAFMGSALRCWSRPIRRHSRATAA